MLSLYLTTKHFYCETLEWSNLAYSERNREISQVCENNDTVPSKTWPPLIQKRAFEIPHLI